MIPDGKSKDAFRTIAETAEILGVQQHVLRYWESQFEQVAPVKRAGNRRNYRPSDVALLAGLKQLLRVERYTLKGVRRILEQHGVDHVAELGRQSLTNAGSTLFAPQQTDTSQTEIVPEKRRPEVTRAMVPAAVIPGKSASFSALPESQPVPEDSVSSDAGSSEGCEPETVSSLTAQETEIIARLISRLLVLRDRTAADIEAARTKFDLASPPPTQLKPLPSRAIAQSG